MILDARTIPAGRKFDADLCIIGAGAAGITLAREFIGTSKRVILLESGFREPDARSQALTEGESVGLPYFPLETTRLRIIGGATNHYGGLTRPMDREDLEVRSWIPHSGWPIEYTELESRYERARQIMGGRGADDWDLETWIDKDRFKPLPIPPDRIATRFVRIVPKKSRSFRDRYQSELQGAGNVTLHVGANVVDLETNPAGTLVTLVRVATLDGLRYAVAARQVILAAGGIENPRILLAANRQWPRGLGNAHDLVGRFFMEHPRFIGGILAPSDPDLPVEFYRPHRVGPCNVTGYLAVKEEVRRAEGLVRVHVNLLPKLVDSFQRALDSPDLAHLRKVVAASRGSRTLRHFDRHLANVVADLTTWQSMSVPGAPLPVPYPEVVGQLMRSTPHEAQALLPDLFGDIFGAAYAKTVHAPYDTIGLRTRIDPVPNPDSRVTLATERDALGIPKARLDWRLSDLDHTSVRRTLEILGAEVGKAGLGRVRITLDANPSVWPADLAGGWHHMGTTRMSDDPKRGVVDRNCRVHGIQNLFVAGSSVFPTAGSGTPTLTLVALSLRLAERLKGVLA